MAYGTKLSLAVAMAMCLAGSAYAAPDNHDNHDNHGGAKPGAAAHADVHAPEPHPGPTGYKRVTEPQGWNKRPATADKGTYQHNFQAARSYKIGPYHPPRGWSAHHWVYGQTLPRAYWAAQYLLADYWLFGLEVPPVGYEWVRDGGDALLIDTSSGQILQVEYGVFA